MRSSPRNGSTFILLLVALTACDDGVALGRPCVLTPVPCDPNGLNCGFAQETWYLQQGTHTCPGDVCVVYHLDNGTAGAIPADPAQPCDGPSPPLGCVSKEALDEAMYCSCLCAVSGKQTHDTCRCGEGFVCEGFAGTSDSFCVREGQLN